MAEACPKGWTDPHSRQGIWFEPFRDVYSTVSPPILPVDLVRYTSKPTILPPTFASTLTYCRGHSPGVKFPRVLGIEAVGLVESSPGGEFQKDDVVSTCMGGMGRDFDGGYAEYTWYEIPHMNMSSFAEPRAIFRADTEPGCSLYSNVARARLLVPHFLGNYSANQRIALPPRKSKSSRLRFRGKFSVPYMR